MGQSELCTMPMPSFDDAGSANADASNHESGDSSWESVWIDLGGEG
jgi:hypothetical protein